MMQNRIARCGLLVLLAAGAALVGCKSNKATGMAVRARSTTQSSADVRLPQIFGDHMVLQAGKEIPVWGWAKPGEKVVVRLGDGPGVTAKTGANGLWSVRLKGREASATPTTLTVTGDHGDVARFEDVLVGEVWVGSGQSNMQWTLTQAGDAQRYIAEADHPTMRLYTVPRRAAGEPAEDFGGKWVVCTPETAKSFGAVLYHFGRNILGQLNVPVGLINTSWGGTPIMSWTPREGYSDEQLAADTARARRADEPVATLFPGTQPVKPPAKRPQNYPNVLYNAMVSPMAGYGIRGVLWYQGENDVYDAGQRRDYADRMKRMVSQWRSAWGEEFPFYYVQIAPFGGYRNAADTDLPELIEQQAKALEIIPNSGMAPTGDIGNVKNIHPANKHDVGLRLANLALAKTYGKSGVPHVSPTYAGHEVKDGKLRVHFDGAEGGLKTLDGKAPTGFEIAGADGRYFPADAVIEGSDVLLSSDYVNRPKSVRFAWSSKAEVKLVNAAGWPAILFRSEK